nr:Uncharacterised protein [Klebsiella pneumoniae]
MGAAILSNYRMLSAESDRGAVLLASSIIERGLTELICAFLLESDNKEMSSLLGQPLLWERLNQRSLWPTGWG